MRLKQIIKKIIMGMLILSTVVTGAFFSMKETKAATSYEYEDKIIYTKEIDNAVELYNGKVAPTKAGYLFGGWFEDANGDTQVTTNAVDNGAELYAKFVPAYVLSVKAQNHKNVSSSSDKGDMRVVSSVDNSAHYKEIGFDLYFGNRDDGNYKQTAKGTKVYTKIFVKHSDNKQETFVPQDVFGSQANYFNIAVIQGIGSKSFGSIIYAKPYWVTNDGTKVYGLGKYVCVQDGLDGIISIPINIYTAQKIAAGYVELTYPEGLTYYKEDGFKAGSRLLSEMLVEEVDSQNHIIRCVGNVADPATGGLTANTDLYVSLRFKVAEDYKDKVTVGKTRLNFTISDTQFCNWEEELVPMSDYVWNIQY